MNTNRKLDDRTAGTIWCRSCEGRCWTISIGKVHEGPRCLLPFILDNFSTQLARAAPAVEPDEVSLVSIAVSPDPCHAVRSGRVLYTAVKETVIGKVNIVVAVEIGAATLAVRRI